MSLDVFSTGVVGDRLFAAVGRDLLVQLLLDHFFIGSCAESSPKSVGALGAGNGGRTAVISDLGRCLITGFDRIGNEYDGAITHQDVSTALVLT